MILATTRRAAFWEISWLRTPVGASHPGFTGLPAAMQLGNSPHMGNIADMDRTSTKWSVRLEQGRSRSRVLRNRALHNREQWPKPHQVTRAQDRGQERLRFHRSNLHHHSLLLCGSIEQMMVRPPTLKGPWQ